MRIREYVDSNYKSVFFNGKTVRMKHNVHKPIISIPTPEIEDVAINDKCFANCSYCYTSAVKSGTNFKDIIGKAHNVWGKLDIKERPFQIAIGGAGESTIHPDWVEFVTEVKGLGITPNYTTNGMHLSDKIIETTENICGGVALSWHPHISKIFHESMVKLSGIKTKLNFHVIIGSEQSLIDLQNLYEQYEDKVDYFVLLPYSSTGRAKEIETQLVWEKTFKWVKSVNENKFAFGTLFYEWLLNNKIDLSMSIYEPEIYSGYRVMNDTYKNLYKSSYNLTLK
jgi:organic radical activating enzyme